MFNQGDLRQFEEAGIHADTVSTQLEHFKTGFPFPEIIAPAAKGSGIQVMNRAEREEAMAAFAGFRGNAEKFVPASGAATRMFKELFDAKALLERGEEIKDGSSASLFFAELDSFAFYSELSALPGFSKTVKADVITLLLDEKGLNYGSLPKGLLKFHKYGNKSRTPYEEHLHEAAEYTENRSGEARVTFSVSPEHLGSFKELENSVKPVYEQLLKTRFDISYTLQKRSTDTVAADPENRPFRKSDGSILFRPGGHGALIENLNETESEIVFIKNIDNVSREENLPLVSEWKKILGGKLLLIRERIFGYLEKLDGEFNPELNKEVEEFLEKTFCIKLPSLPQELYKDFIIAKLNRPVRVCGMVKNQGEPGGGPFIVRDADGSTSLQILEGAQINFNDPVQKERFSHSTHFNPVDIVCSLTDYKGNRFNLMKYVDQETGFISYKSYEGRPLKALELPGLWNGAMSNWNTAFIEVPVETFSPVKSVMDLLRPEHRES